MSEEEIKPGNVLTKRDSERKIVVRKSNIEEIKSNASEYVKVSERPHQDNDFSYLCGGDYCRCCQ